MVGLLGIGAAFLLVRREVIDAVAQQWLAAEDWLADKTKYEAVDILRKFDIPCSPVLSMKELLHDKSLRASGSIVEVQHKERGSYFTVGSPIKFSDLKPEITGSPLLGEHSDEVLASLGYTPAQIKEMHDKEVV